jgi:hypothetical protein
MRLFSFFSKLVLSAKEIPSKEKGAARLPA